MANSIAAEIRHVTLRPAQVTFLTTNTCTAKCDHCSVYSSPKRRGSLTSTQMIQAIDDLNWRNELKLVIFAGGEPTLLGTHLLDTIAYADSLGIATRMVTNAHWATSHAVAVARVVELREAGLREINLSCDDYHTPFIPLKRIKIAWDATKGVGFGAVVIASASGPNSRLSPLAIRKLLGEDVPFIYDDDGCGVEGFPVDDGSVRIISNANVSRIGRGSELIPADDVKFPPRQALLDRPCAWIARSPAVSPTNHLLSCCGMEASQKRHLDYGALETRPARELLDAAANDVIVQALAVLGPYRLMQMLKQLEPDVLFWSKYGSVCEVCAHMFERKEVVALLEKHLDTIALLVETANAIH